MCIITCKHLPMHKWIYSWKVLRLFNFCMKGINEKLHYCTSITKLYMKIILKDFYRLSAKPQITVNVHELVYCSLKTNLCPFWWWCTRIDEVYTIVIHILHIYAILYNSKIRSFLTNLNHIYNQWKCS